MSSTAGKGRRKTGALKGQVSVFAGGEMHVIEVDAPITVGREKGNKIRLRDDLVSRVHCRISPTEAGFLLEDQASRNGTWLNGIRVERSELKSGDVVDVGRCTLFFTMPDRETHLDCQVAEAKEDGGHQTMEIKALGGGRAAGFDGRGVVGVEELSAIVRDRNKLLHLSQITKAITSEQDLDRLFEKIIDSATELTQARRGFLVLPEGRDFTVAVARPARETGAAAEGPDKRTVRRALQEGRLSRTAV
ncbi:MAG: FHA domain-containing protein, partial [Planctomycetes bacterium]|nr:FHA domain-containing protein [Planctomycetota bacterium]